MPIRTCLLLFTLVALCLQIESFGLSALGDLLKSGNANAVEGPAAAVARNICTMNVTSSGKTCSCSVPEVDCSHLGIDDLPPEITFPLNISFADFQGNLFEDIRDDTFYDGGGVQKLDLSHNHINFISFVAFIRFTKLNELILSHNALWNIPVRVFEGLLNLKELDLSSNDISNIFSDTFKPLKKLKILSLAKNPLLELKSNQFQYLPSLEKLDLEDTLLTVIPDYLFSYTPNLRYLSLSNNHISGVTSNSLRSLNMVHTLDLSGNPVKMISSGAFYGMQHLMVLYLNRMSKLNSIEKYAFGGLKNLRELHCSYNFVLDYIDEDAFLNSTTKELVTVQQLFLMQNNLMALPENLQKWSTDMELHVKGNPWYCDCLLKWMVKTELKNKFQEQVRCLRPFHLKDRVLSTLNEEDLTCDLTYIDVIVISCASVAAFLLVLLIIAFCIWRRHFSGFSRTYFRISKKSDSDDVVYEKAIDA